MRISFDLDEVLFVNPNKYEVEPALPFPLNKLYPERLRKGTIELIHELKNRGFEVWIYTSSFRSDTYIKALFWNYGITFDDIINGYRHNAEVQQNKPMNLPQKIPNYYRISLHIDDEDIIVKNSRAYGYHVLKIYEEDNEWVQKVIAEAERIRMAESE